MELVKCDISWFFFNYWVFQEVMDKLVFFYECIKFLVIYSFNFDEFYWVWVVFLCSFKELKKKIWKVFDLEIKFKKEFKQICRIVQEQ